MLITKKDDFYRIVVSPLLRNVQYKSFYLLIQHLSIQNYSLGACKHLMNGLARTKKFLIVIRLHIFGSTVEVK